MTVHELLVKGLQALVLACGVAEFDHEVTAGQHAAGLQETGRPRPKRMLPCRGLERGERGEGRRERGARCGTVELQCRTLLCVTYVL